MQRPKTARGTVTKHPDGSTTLSLEVKVYPSGQTGVNGQLREQMSATLMDVCEAVCWLEYDADQHNRGYLWRSRNREQEAA